MDSIRITNNSDKCRQQTAIERKQVPVRNTMCKMKQKSRNQNRKRKKKKITNKKRE